MNQKKPNQFEPGGLGNSVFFGLQKKTTKWKLEFFFSFKISVNGFTAAVRKGAPALVKGSRYKVKHYG